MEDNYREVKKAEPCLKLIHMDQVEVEEIEWLFYPFIPYGKVTIIQGDPGEGKTTVVLQIIAKLTKGERYYDKANRESVLMMVIFPIVKLLNEKYYTRNDYEALFEINSSYAVKYLRKKERNKLLELLSAYRDVCKYSKENADTSCIMAYYNYKLKENGINPKPCAITDDDGEVVADDFPPDYNYLQDYVYKIVSSFDFIESPEECTIKIADAFKCYTEKYYTGEEIIYFEDYSVEKVIELSEISKKWNDKFKRADKCKEEFLNLPICKKVKNIIDELSINEYVKNKRIVKKHKEKFTDKFKEEINSLKNTKYSSIYVVVCLIEQAVFLELLKDLTQLISNDKIRLLFYAGGGILSFVIMSKILDMLVKKAGKKIEDDVLMEMQSKGEYVPEKTDKIVECATMLGYMSPFLCVSTWISGIENTQICKWGIIILVHILGIGIPLLVKKKK